MAIYRQRRNLFEKTEWEWEALTEGLRVRDQDAHDVLIPWREIRAVRVAYGPTRFKPWRHLLEMTLADRSKLTVDNVHFRSVANFENRSSTYTPLALAVIENLKQANPDVPVRAGAATAGYWLSVAFISVVFIALALIFMAAPIAGVPGVAWVKLTIIAFFIPTLGAWFVRARPRAVSLHAIPADSLPPMTETTRPERTRSATAA